MAPERPTLLQLLQRIIERTYAMRSGIGDAGRFVLGDAGYRHFYSGKVVRQTVMRAVEAQEVGPRLLLRTGPPGTPLRAAIYYPDALVRRLEQFPPTRGLDERNINEFADFVEELDHFLCVAQWYADGRPFSLLELELHGNVTKYFAASLFLARAGGLDEGGRAWLRWHLFDRREYADEDPSVRDRYRDAARFGWRFVSRLSGMPADRRLESLRAFHRSSLHEKLAELA